MTEPTKPTCVDVHQLAIAYGSRTVLRDISFRVQQGQFISLIGPNGAGKSTLIRTLAGTLTPQHGNVVVLGHEPAHLAPAERARMLAVVPQAIRMPIGFTVREVVAMARYSFHAWYARPAARDDAIIAYALHQAGVAAFADLPADQLSGGEQQRVAFARALAQQPHVLLLDEVTAHLDLHHQQAIIRCAKELTECGVTVIAAMHDINLAGAVSDGVVLLDHGQIVAQGTPEQVLQQAILERVYRAELRAIPQPDAPLPYYTTYPIPRAETHTNH